MFFSNPTPTQSSRALVRGMIYGLLGNNILDSLCGDEYDFVIMPANMIIAVLGSFCLYNTDIESELSIIGYFSGVLMFNLCKQKLKEAAPQGDLLMLGAAG